MDHNFTVNCTTSILNCTLLANRSIIDHSNSDASNQTKIYLYWGDTFEYFFNAYRPFHLPLSTCLCVFGIVTNALNLVVLTRRSMISPTNVLLTGLSAAQLFLLMNYLFMLTYETCATSCTLPVLHSYPARLYQLINATMNVAFHTTALCHTLVLAIFRFMAIKAPAFARTNLNMKTARICVLCLHFVIPIPSSIVFFTSIIIEVNPKEHCDYPNPYDLAYADRWILEATLWTFGIFFKLVPSITIVILSFYLIVSLKKYNDKKDRLTGKFRQTLKSEVTSEISRKQSSVKGVHDRRTGKNRTARGRLTKMLVTVALLCVAVEFPHGIMNLLTAIFGAEFGEEVYNNLGNFFEMITLFYSSVNFILYCAMSTEFQRTFSQLFWLPVRNALVYRLFRKPIPLAEMTLLHRSSCTDTNLR